MSKTVQRNAAGMKGHDCPIDASPTRVVFVPGKRYHVKWKRTSCRLDGGALSSHCAAATALKSMAIVLVEGGKMPEDSESLNGWMQ